MVIGGVVLQFFRDVSVVFQHGTAAGNIDHDGVELLAGEGSSILVHESDGRFCGTRMIVNGAAAGLGGGDDDVAAILLQDSGCCPVDMAEHGIGDAADEQSDFCAWFSDGGQECWQRWFAGSQSGELVVQSLNFGGQQFCESAAAEECIEPE